MSNYDFRVPPLSWNNIGDIADKMRADFGFSDISYVPIMPFLEKIMDNRLGIYLLSGDEDDMKRKRIEGHTDPNGEFIVLREDVMRHAWDGQPRARFTAAHELGHWVLHTRIQLARAAPEDNVKWFSRSEPQANQFAAEFLMPRCFFQAQDDECTAMDRHGVSFEAATKRLNFLRKKGII